MSTSKVELASTYDIKPGEYPKIDGVVIPWYLQADGPRVEAPTDQADFGMHILWLPVIIDAPLPAYTVKKPGVPPSTPCQEHNPVQHRDQKPPWCKECGAA